MSYTEIFAPANEKPLDHPMPAAGGMCSIFRKIGCVGDSLASGEFELVKTVSSNEDETNAQIQRIYLDMFEYSWGQHLARIAGCTALNFSRGGMTAKEYCTSFAQDNDFWNPEKACQAYIIGLGVNDVINVRQTIGSVSDICNEDWHKNADTFAGWFGQLLARLREIQPHAPLFLLTMPRTIDWENAGISDIIVSHASLMYDMADHFGNSYVIDLYKYGPVLDDEYKKLFFMNGHLNAVGYRVAAEQIVTYIDYIIRHNPEAFNKVGLIGTPYYI